MPFSFITQPENKKFIEYEEYAKDNKLGLWQTEFQFPWDFRKSKKN